MTKPKPAELSVKAGQNIGTLLSKATSIKEFFFFPFDFKYFPSSTMNSLEVYAFGFNELAISHMVLSQACSSSSSI